MMEEEEDIPVALDESESSFFNSVSTRLFGEDEYRSEDDSPQSVMDDIPMEEAPQQDLPMAEADIPVSMVKVPGAFVHTQVNPSSAAPYCTQAQRNQYASETYGRLPLMVTREQHPLHTGIPGKLYNRHDRVEPILDSVESLVAGNTYEGTIAMIVAREREVKEMMELTKKKVSARPVQEPETPASTTPASVQFENVPDPEGFVQGRVNASGNTPEEQRKEDAQANHVMRCEMCGATDDPKDGLPMLNVTLTDDKDAYVCGCGNVFMAKNTISLHREKNCAESEDNTQHAEKAYQPRLTSFDQPALSAEESRKQRVREQSNTFLNPKAARKMGFGFTHQTIAREAAAEARREGHVTESNPYGWTAQERSRADALMRALEELITKYRPISNEIAFYLRSQTTGLWSRVVFHDRVCSAADTGIPCRLMISTRTAKTIAEAAFDYHVDRLLLGGDALQHSIPLESVRDLKERVAAQRKTLNAHKISTRSMVSLVMENDIDKPCAPEETVRSSFASASPGSPSLRCENCVVEPQTSAVVPSFGRAESLDHIPGEEPSVSPMLTFRQSVMRVHKLMGSVSTEVRDLALDMISSDFFAVVERHGMLSALIKQEPAKIAFAFLMSVETRRPKSGKERVKDMQRVRGILGFDDKEATTLTAEMLGMLPPNVWENASSVGGEEDNLFG